ncbi:peroxisomal membrane protein PEX16-like [Anneissia japonica]|uniref:peroxisomal membrane protein PEX16-like n=1 Tax=Anneissia japonica TaxID=1529436 RepID=UPI001425826B|nr:peroxisomal membrane protein PEX16-like [Anneissia japonica]
MASSTTLDTVWEKVFERYKETWSWYEHWVSKNPTTVAHIENTFRILSYMIAGRFEESQVMSELIFAASNLLVLFHDNIFRRTLETFKSNICFSQARLMQWLTITSYMEVFIELAASRIGGEFTRWTMILVVQIFKATLRLILLLKYKYGIQKSTPISPVKRENIKAEEVNDENDAENNQSEKLSTSLTKGDLETSTHKEELTESLFKGRRCGRTVRTLKSSPPLSQRTWKLPEDKTEVSRLEVSMEPTELSKQRLIGEGIHIIRPLAHLSSMFCFGMNSWTPWLLSIGLDLSSLHFIGETDDLNPEEKSEVKRRTTALLIYLLRSPFFDRYSKMRILSMLKGFSQRFPASSLIIGPLMEYLPIWQTTYFYNWTV